MRYSDPTLQIATTSYTLQFNVTDANGVRLALVPDKCSGLDGAALRVTNEPKSQTSGLILHPSFKDGRHIVLGGTVYLDSGDFDDLQTSEDTWIAALAEIENTDGTLSWLSATRSIAVRYEIAIEFSGVYPKSFHLGLIAADPTITSS